MSKIQILLFTLAFVALAFTVGYKAGDAHGYNEGYDVGYRYDCKDEIANLYEQVKNTSKGIEYAEKQLRSLTRSNDSLRRPGIYDSMHVRYTRDSLVYHKVSRKYNDSLRNATGSSIRNIILDDGRINSVACLIDPKLKGLPECKPGWRIAK